MFLIRASQRLSQAVLSPVCFGVWFGFFKGYSTHCSLEQRPLAAYVWLSTLSWILAMAGGRGWGRVDAVRWVAGVSEGGGPSLTLQSCSLCKGGEELNNSSYWAGGRKKMLQFGFLPFVHPECTLFLWLGLGALHPPCRLLPLLCLIFALFLFNVYLLIYF